MQLLAHNEPGGDRYEVERRVLSAKLTSIRVVWLFVQWLINLVGPLSQYMLCTYIIVAIVYFSKWIEVNALTTTTEF